METVALVYLMLGGVTLFGFGIVTLVIAGKDIFYAFYRKIVPTGCDVFVVNYNRQINHYYKIPKQEGYFKIHGKTYILNPSKVLSLSEEERIEVQKSVKKRDDNINKRIHGFLERKGIILLELEKIKDISEAENVRQQLNAEVATLDEKISLLKDRLKDKNKTYYHNRRPTVLYIENDPVPKDLFEFYTEFDAIMMDNIIARSMTKDPKAVHDMDKFLKLFKLILLVIAGVTAFTLLVTLKNQTALDQIAKNLGMTIKI